MYPAIIVLKSDLNVVFILSKSKHLISFSFALLRIFYVDKFSMVYKEDGNPQLDSRDWSMDSNILNGPARDTRWSNLSGNIRKYLKKKTNKQITFINAKIR